MVVVKLGKHTFHQSCSALQTLMVSRPLKRTDSLVVYGKSSFCGKGVYSLHFKTLDSPGKHFILFDCCRKAANMLICCKMLMMTISFERVDLSTALCAYIIIITGDLCDSAVCLKCFLSLAVARCPFLGCTGSPPSMWGEQRMPSSQRPTTAYTSSSKSLSST